MIIKGMEHFQNVCKNRLVDWYNLHSCPGQPHIDVDDVFVVWSCKTLQNYKALLSTTVCGDGIYAEYTYNGDKQELYEDVYKKLTNTCIKEESKDSIKESLKNETVLTDEAAEKVVGGSIPDIPGIGGICGYNDSAVVGNTYKLYGADFAHGVI